MPEPVDVLRQAILAAPAPVLMLDTSATLDIIRVPLRDNLSHDIIRSAGSLANAATQVPPKLWLIAAERVQIEWADNAANVQGEVRDHVRSLQKKVDSFFAAAKYISPGSGYLGPDLVAQTIDKGLYTASAALLGSSKIMATDNECIILASMRAVLGIAPASKGKPETGDCEIIQHYLELGNGLRAAGFPGKMCFVSSNSQDYGPPGRPREPLDSELATIALKYLPNLSAAAGYLGL